MPRPDLSRLTPEEKDALILALLDGIAALEAKLGAAEFLFQLTPRYSPNN